MKKLFAPIALIAFAGMLFSSCSNTSKMSITKRHYRSGYYVDFGGSKPTPAIAKVPAKTKHQTAPIITAVPENNVVLNVPIDASVKSGKVQKITSSQKIQISENKVFNSSPSTRDNFVTNGGATNIFSESPGLQSKQNLSETTSNDDGGGERAALSLLWLIVVVILILWLIGILAGGFGLGPLINLLLLIALIIFILWLLRIA